MKKEISVGYKAISVIKLLNGVGAYHSKKLSFKALRVYIACYELEAIREAAKRSSKLKSGKINSSWVRYEKKELIRLTGGLTLRSIGKGLKELERASVMKFSKNKITFTDTPIPESRELLENALSSRKGGRGGARAIPVPRAMLKFLSSTNKPSLFLTIIAYMIRGLSVKRNANGANTKKINSINNRGTVKASWISKVFKISIRAVKGARAEMVSIALIERDTGSYQRKLNRDGAYFQLNINWSKTSRNGKINITNTNSKPVNNFLTPVSKLAPPKPKNRTESAPPYKKLKTSKENKNQKTWKSKPTGVCTLENIKIEDLKRTSSVMSLYHQAVLAGWLQKSKANQQNCIGAALRATSINARNPAGVFIKIIKNKLWNHITQAQEDRAISAFKRYEQKKIETKKREISNLDNLVTKLTGTLSA